MTLKIVLGGYLLVWGMIYYYIDKILLMILSAREVIDTDQQELFQCIKNESYKSFEKLPRVYLYSGLKKTCFIFESRAEWALVIERSLLKQMSLRELEALVEFLYKLKKEDFAWYQTKAMGVCLFLHRIVYWFLKNILFLKPNSKLYKSLAVFMLSMLRPLIYPIDALARTTFPITVKEEFKNVFFQLEPNDFSFENYIVEHYSHVISIKNLLLYYLESFPVLENCRFKDYEAK